MTLLRGDWFYVVMTLLTGFFMARPYLYAIQNDNYRISEIFRNRRLRTVYLIDLASVAVFFAIWLAFFFFALEGILGISDRIVFLRHGDSSVFYGRFARPQETAQIHEKSGAMPRFRVVIVMCGCNVRACLCKRTPFPTRICAISCFLPSFSFFRLFSSWHVRDQRV